MRLEFRPSSASSITTDVSTWSLKQLRQFVTKHGVDPTGMYERAEFENAVADLLKQDPSLLAGPVSPVQLDVACQESSGAVDESPRIKRDLQLSGTQKETLTAMLMDHAMGTDICLVAPRGMGKSTLVRTH
jgi:superfamily II DNA or RNA helicase